MARHHELQRLPGTGRRFIGSHQLWLGPGHLLLVENTGYREHYRRVELADVQAFVIRRTDTAVVRMLILGGLLLVLMGVVLGFGLALGWLTPAALVALLLLADLALGPSCTVLLRTPVQLLPVPSLGRWRRARRVIARLRPLIEEAQRTLAVEELRARIDEIPPLPGAPAHHSASATERRSQPRTISAWPHSTLAVLLLIRVLVAVGQVMSSSAPIGVAGFAMWLVDIAVAVTAVARQVGSTLPAMVRRWAWSSLVYLSLLFTTGAVWFGVYLAGDLVFGDVVLANTIVCTADAFCSGLLFSTWAVLEIRRRAGGG